MVVKNHPVNTNQYIVAGQKIMCGSIQPMCYHPLPGLTRGFDRFLFIRRLIPRPRALKGDNSPLPG